MAKGKSGGLFGGSVFIGGPVGAATAALTKFAEGLEKTTVNLVKLANPARVELFNMAVADAGAVIGQRLTPVLEVMTDAMRVFGDFLASILPSTGEFRAAMVGAKELLKELKNVLASLVPVIRNALLWSLKELAKALAFTAGVVKGLFGGGEFKFPNTSRGAAAQPSQIFSDIASIAEAADLAAVSGASIDQQSLDTQKEIKEFVEEINRMMKESRATGEAIGGAVRKSAQEHPLGEAVGWASFLTPGPYFGMAWHALMN